jgi:eukaryotic-like serine/threonine-protein kinase
VAALDSQETTRLMQTTSRAIYAEPGYLLYVRDGTLMARAFDVRSLSLSGPESVAAADLLFLREVGQADFSISRNGVLAYQAGFTASRLVWYQRNGTPGSAVGEPGEFTDLRLSPDERKVAVIVFNRQAGTTDIRLLDLARGGEASAVTSDAALDLTPVFSPDSQQLAFAAGRRGPAHVFVKRLTDPGPGEELVPPSFGPQFVYDWASSADGQLLLYNDSGGATGMDIMAIDPTGARPARAVVNTTANQMDGHVSPDGKWLAYTSTETGRSEVYVRSLQTGQQWPVSSTGAVSPRWRRARNGSDNELYYLSHISRLPFAPSAVDGALMAVRITTEGSFRAGVPQRLFSVFARAGQFEPSRDGERFLVNVVSGNASLPITIALDWRRMISR